jgi:hypothetical protein
LGNPGFETPEKNVFNSDVEQQIYYLKRDATQQYFASACSVKGGLVQKRRDYYLKKKPSSGILHQSKPQSVVMTSSEFSVNEFFTFLSNC